MGANIAAIVYWLGYVALNHAERGRNPLAAPICSISAHVAEPDYEPGIRNRSCKWRFDSSHARQFLDIPG